MSDRRNLEPPAGEMENEMGYTCNGSPNGCERERFGMCDWHDSRQRTYSVTYEIDGSVVARIVQAGGMAEATENVLKDYGYAEILAVVNVTN